MRGYEAKGGTGNAPESARWHMAAIGRSQGELRALQQLSDEIALRLVWRRGVWYLGSGCLGVLQKVWGESSAWAVCSWRAAGGQHPCTLWLDLVRV